MGNKQVTFEDLAQILFLIGGLLLNPFLPSFGLQAMLSIAIGMMLPQRVVEPISRVLHKIPVVNIVIHWFENRLMERKRLKTVISRVIAGYFFTSLIGGVFILIACLL